MSDTTSKELSAVDKLLRLRSTAASVKRVRARLDELLSRREEEMRAAVEAGASQRQVAEAAATTQARVAQILAKKGAADEA